LAAEGLSAAESAKLERLIFNDYLDATITAVFMVLVIVVVVDSARVWFSVMNQKRGIDTRDYVLVR